MPGKLPRDKEFLNAVKKHIDWGYRPHHAIVKPLMDVDAKLREAIFEAVTHLPPAAGPSLDPAMVEVASRFEEPSPEASWRRLGREQLEKIISDSKGIPREEVREWMDGIIKEMKPAIEDQMRRLMKDAGIDWDEFKKTYGIKD